MNQYNNDATLDIAIETRHHTTIGEKIVGTAKIIQGRLTGSTSKLAEGHLQRDGHLDHRFPNEARARAEPCTEKGKRDLIREATIGQKEYEDGVGTLSTNPEMGRKERERVNEVERSVSDRSVASTDSGAEPLPRQD